MLFWVFWALCGLLVTTIVLVAKTVPGSGSQIWRNIIFAAFFFLIRRSLMFLLRTIQNRNCHIPPPKKGKKNVFSCFRLNLWLSAFSPNFLYTLLPRKVYLFLFAVFGRRCIIQSWCLSVGTGNITWHLMEAFCSKEQNVFFEFFRFVNFLKIICVPMVCACIAFLMYRFALFMGVGTNLR